MNSLQTQSLKIQKIPKETAHKFLCGCSRSYQSYAALRLHIKRRHNSIMPPNTIIIKPVRPDLETAVMPGRPSKSSKDIDRLCGLDEAVEIAQNDLMSFIGEKLAITKDLSNKMTLEMLALELSQSLENNKDKWLLDIQEETVKILVKRKQKGLKTSHFDPDEDLIDLDAENCLQIVTWFLIWLMEIYVQIQFISDLAFVFSRIWKVLDDEKFEVQDLDNKLVWKKVMREVEDSNSIMQAFRKDSILLNNFIEKTCQLIGKLIERKQRLSNHSN